MVQKKETIQWVLPLISWIILGILVGITNFIINNSFFIFDEFDKNFREPRWANGLLMKYNSNIAYQKKNCDNKIKIAILGNSVFWEGGEGEHPEQSIAGYIKELLKDQYCILNFTSIGTSIVNWYSQSNFLNSTYKPNIIIIPVMYSQMIRGDNKIGVEEVTELTLESLDIKTFLFMNTKFSYYTSGVKLNLFNLLEEYLPVIKYKRDIIYELNQAIWKDVSSACPIEKCSISIQQLFYNLTKQNSPKNNRDQSSDRISEKNQKEQTIKNASLETKKIEEKTIIDKQKGISTICKNPQNENTKKHFQFVMNNFQKQINNKNPFWYFYRKLNKNTKNKILFVTTPFNYDGFKKEGIDYDPNILNTKLNNFIQESHNIAILDSFYTPYLDSSLFQNYAHLTKDGSRYMAELIINKIKEKQW